ncbi:MAG: Uma2 family endonuclease [Synechococcales cyanobacterium T60_A2020_003]|nr:Uma2 family endonuclease [Synechococcales cyanobacterium T60_A2020_003]
MTFATTPTIELDTWTPATWEEFVAIANSPEYAKSRAYFDQGQMRIEMAPIGANHAHQNAIVSKVIGLFAALRHIQIIEFINCSFRKTGERECQPDLAFYIGTEFQLPPKNNSPINVEVLGAPTLAVEIGASSLSDDLGAKRLLYERLGVAEYWVVDVAQQRIIAFSVAEGRSGQIQTSEVLPGLEMALVNEALAKTQSDDDGAITRWLMQTLT